MRNVWYIAHLRQQCHNSKCVIFRKRLLKVLKCRNFLRAQRLHDCSPAASFANCVMTLYLLKVHLQVFLSIPITQKCQILSCDTLVPNTCDFPSWNLRILKPNESIVLNCVLGVTPFWLLPDDGDRPPKHVGGNIVCVFYMQWMCRYLVSQ
jgi:hypothetical protein